MSLSIKYWLKNCTGYIKLLENTDNYPAPYTKIITPTVISLIKKYTTKDDRIIDFGCGEGYLTRKIKQYRPFVEGADLSMEMITAAKEQDNTIPYHQLDLEKPSTIIPPDKFHLVISTLVFMYIEKIDVALKNISRTLIKGGRVVIITTHPCFYQQENFQWFQDEDSYEPYQLGNYLHERTTIRNIAEKFKTHHIHRTIGSYVKAFHQADFDIVDILEPKPIATSTTVLKKVNSVPIYAFFVLQKKNT